MATNLNTISEILKDQYLPALKNLVTTATHPFMEMIRKTPLTTAGMITAVAPFGINGGFGFGIDGESLPKASGRRYKRFEVEPVDMYVDICISDKTVKLANQPGALISALDDEVIGSYEAAKWNVARALFGDGTGILCTVDQSCSSIDGMMTIRVNSTERLVEGLVVDMYTYPSTTNPVPIIMNDNKGLRIIDINRFERKITVEGDECAATIALSSTGKYGFLTVQGSYQKELTGLGAIFNASVPMLYGYSKSITPFIKPLEFDACNSLSDSLLYHVVKKAEDYRNSKIDLIMMGDEAFAAYQEYMRENNVTICERAEFIGGASGYKVIVGSRAVTVINESMVPTGQCWCVDTSAFNFVHLDFDFCNLGDGGIFQLVPGTTYYRALLSSYGNLICNNPGGCVLVVNCEI